MVQLYKVATHSQAELPGIFFPPGLSTLSTKRDYLAGLVWLVVWFLSYRSISRYQLTPFSLLQVWQAIEKVLLEDSMSSKSPDTERPQFTELSPAKEFQGPTSVTKSGSVLTELSSVPQLHIPDGVYSIGPDNCKVKKIIIMTRDHRDQDDSGHGIISDWSKFDHN